MNIQEVLKKELRVVPDFPKPGIQFFDVTTLMINPHNNDLINDYLCRRYSGLGITKIVGIEARGFIYGAILAKALNVGFVPVRKSSKLPYLTYSESYSKEYDPKDTIHIHVDALSHSDVVLIHDDVLATGGSMEAAIKLVRKCNVEKIYINVLIEITDLNGKQVISNYDADFHSIMQL